nr:sugar phosphate isomerase/epimerase [bacterium]
MQLSVLTVLFSDQPLADVAKYLASKGVQALEIGTGGFPGDAHCKPAELLADSAKLAEFKKIFEDNGLSIAALSVHGNAVHPDAAVAKKAEDEFNTTLKLAEKLGVTRVVTFSGCPGDHAGAKYPNWVTCPWPEDFLAVLDYQWNECLIPYWQKASARAAEHGVDKIALEMHPGFCVYNPETTLRLRQAAGSNIGANVDPSHLFWQGIDPVAAILKLGKAIHYFHAKDTYVDPYNTAVNGVLDTKHYAQEMERSWLFRTVGYGHDTAVWRDIFSALRKVGYDGPISIEHEDGLMSQKEGLEKAIELLKQTIIFEGRGEIFWA